MPTRTAVGPDLGESVAVDQDPPHRVVHPGVRREEGDPCAVPRGRTPVAASSRPAPPAPARAARRAAPTCCSLRPRVPSSIAPPVPTRAMPTHSAHTATGRPPVDAEEQHAAEEHDRRLQQRDHEARQRLAGRRWPRPGTGPGAHPSGDAELAGRQQVDRAVERGQEDEQGRAGPAASTARMLAASWPGSPSSSTSTAVAGTARPPRSTAACSAVRSAPVSAATDGHHPLVHARLLDRGGEDRAQLRGPSPAPGEYHRNVVTPSVLLGDPADVEAAPGHVVAEFGRGADLDAVDVVQRGHPLGDRRRQRGRVGVDHARAGSRRRSRRWPRPSANTISSGSTTRKNRLERSANSRRRLARVIATTTSPVAGAHGRTTRPARMSPGSPTTAANSSSAPTGPERGGPAPGPPVIRTSPSLNQ